MGAGLGRAGGGLMPQRALQPCAYHGCPTLVTSGYCTTHRPMRGAEVNYHDRESQRLYSTVRWQRRREQQLSTQPWCEECLRANIYTPATDVDHVLPHRGDEELFFTGKVQSLCKNCHSRKTISEVNGRKGKGDKKVLNTGDASAAGGPHEKISQYGESA